MADQRTQEMADQGTQELGSGYAVIMSVQDTSTHVSVCKWTRNTTSLQIAEKDYQFFYKKGGITKQTQDDVAEKYLRFLLAQAHVLLPAGKGTVPVLVSSTDVELLGDGLYGAVKTAVDGSFYMNGTRFKLETYEDPDANGKPTVKAYAEEEKTDPEIASMKEGDRKVLEGFFAKVTKVVVVLRAPNNSGGTAGTKPSTFDSLIYKYSGITNVNILEAAPKVEKIKLGPDKVRPIGKLPKRLEKVYNHFERKTNLEVLVPKGYQTLEDGVCKSQEYEDGYWNTPDSENTHWTTQKYEEAMESDAECRQMVCRHLTKSLKHAAIIDAGSSGTRLFFYSWDECFDDSVDNIWKAVLPKTITPWKKEASTDKTKGGIHSLAPVDAHSGGKPRKDLAKKTADSVRNYLDPIFEVADKYLKSPDSEPLDKASIPLFMLATGGMRSLKQSHYEAFQILRKAITDYLNASGYFEPVYDTISGEDEGIFGWLAANHETSRLQAEEPPRGFMEMGGQSAQIAFEPSEDDKEHYEGPLTAVNLGKRTYYVFTKTWPMLGADAMWRKHEQRLREKKAEEDPCLPEGYSYKLADSDITIKGTGDPELKACLRETWSLLECQDAACTAGELCALRKGGPGGCLLKDIPGLGFHGQGKGGSFLGASVFWHATNGVFGGENSGQGDSKKSSENPYNVVDFFKEVKDLFSHNWEEIKSSRPREEVNEYKYLPMAFFKACLIMTTLHLGFGLPMPTSAMEEVSQAIRDFVQEANGNNGILRNVRLALELATFPSDADGRFTTVEAASWTLGRIILCAVHCTPRLMTCDGWKKRPVTPVQLQTDVD